PDPDKFRKQKEKSPYKKISNWFGDGNTVDLLNDISQVEFERVLKSIPGLLDLVKEFHKNQDQQATLFLMEFALHGLAEYSLISKHNLTAGLQFKDLLSSMFTIPRPGTEDDDEDDDDVAGRKF
ncbi:MAG: magnesium chelatase, partial [Marivirga sp.]|nr:magnesium chelatase [Marivirga sp.]